MSWDEGALTAELLNGGPLLRLLPGLGELLVPGPHGLQQQADAVLRSQQEGLCMARGGRLLPVGFSPSITHFEGDAEPSPAVTTKRSLPHTPVSAQVPK